ncbi:LysE family translocator [Microbulbifer sp. 2205BS26-8]|uniref:LysE family translocator n=1 Tax=Microbulbifer sp. 2205BS26-8 TaxID=3064386 RepID=UPI002740028B|nr:LysE family translocator [Microbulbifer sp. 2205BS26-8]MDP5210640.1 LysE family translocator [Microbulbifer sp. 2205BS26-8]
MDLSVLTLLVPASFFVSVTPGLCMMLALSLGITVGVRHTLWMMAGELVGVALVALAAVLGAAVLIMQHPAIFQVLKYCGGAYLAWMGVQMWRSQGQLAILDEAERGVACARPSARALMAQGFVTDVANPKGWAFFIALLPPFINQSKPLAPQLSVLVTTIVLLETLCLLIYAGGGQGLSRLLARAENVRLINRVSGSLMLLVGIWLALS